MTDAVRDASGFGHLRGGTHADALLTEMLGPGFAAYREEWRRAGRLDTLRGPLHLDFELNRSCNLRCPMCTWSAETATNEPASRMALDDFVRIVREGVALGCRSVAFNLVNEPLLRADLPEFVAQAKALGVLDLWLHTNGMLLTETMSRGLIGAGLTRLMVSLDAVTQATYDLIRVGGDLAVVESNIAAFRRLRGETGGRLPLLAVCFVKMALNEHELPDFLAKWEPLVDFFSIQEYFVPPMAGARDLVGTTQATPPAMFQCAMPFQRMGVSYDGTAQPCCSFYGPQIPLGNAKAGVAALWRGRDLSGLRALHAGGRWAEHPVCRACATASLMREAQ